MTRTLRNRQATRRPVGRRPRLRRIARATGVAAVFALSAFAGFGTEPPAVRPVEVADGFTPRPFAISYAVRQEIARAREERRVARAAGADRAGATALAYAAPAPRGPVDRFDDLVDDALALAPPSEDVPVPLMRPAALAGDVAAEVR